MPICPTKQMQNWWALSCVLWLRRTEKASFRSRSFALLCKTELWFMQNHSSVPFLGIKNRAVLRRETERMEPTKPEKIGWAGGKPSGLGKNSCSCTIWKRCCFWWKKIAQYAKTCYTEVASANCTKLFPSTRQKENEKGRVFGYESIGSETAKQF